MGRKAIQSDLINKEEFENMVKIGLDTKDVCDYFMVPYSSLMKWVKIAYETNDASAMIKKLKVEGKLDFLNRQRGLATRNPVISIWLGKNYYDQKETAENGSGDYEDLTPLAELLKDNNNDFENN